MENEVQDKPAIQDSEEQGTGKFAPKCPYCGEPIHIPSHVAFDRNASRSPIIMPPQLRQTEQREKALVAAAYGDASDAVAQDAQIIVTSIGNALLGMGMGTYRHTELRRAERAALNICKRIDTRAPADATAALDALVADKVREAERRKHYISTACYHGNHEECRQKCKFCEFPCRCECHATAIEP